MSNADFYVQHPCNKMFKANKRKHFDGLQIRKPVIKRKDLYDKSIKVVCPMCLGTGIDPLNHVLPCQLCHGDRFIE